MIQRVSQFREHPDGTIVHVPLDDADAETVELARVLVGRELQLSEVIATIRTVSAMYGKQSKISVTRAL